MNTKPFGEHPRIIYLPASTDLTYKSLFVNTCSAMIHARAIGETFGVAVGEFSFLNKPIITSTHGDKEHLRILKDKAIIYDSPEKLKYIFDNIGSIIASRNDWNAYADYNPHTIMKLFDTLIKNIEVD